MNTFYAIIAVCSFLSGPPALECRSAMQLCVAAHKASLADSGDRVCNRERERYEICQALHPGVDCKLPICLQSHIDFVEQCSQDLLPTPEAVSDLNV